MIRWCTFCQSYMGEKLPFDDFSLTHGICGKCLKNRCMSSATDERSKETIEFFTGIFDAVFSNECLIPDMVAKARLLGIQPRDFLYAMLQPALYKVGALWFDGSITVADEHKFSMFAGQLVRFFEDEVQASPKVFLDSPAKNMSILVMPSPANSHVLGSRMLTLLLKLRGFSAFYEHPQSPQKAVEAVSRHNGTVVALSVATATDLAVVEKTIGALSFHHPQVAIVLGGYFFKVHGIESWKNLPIAQSEEELLSRIETPAFSADKLASV